MVVLNVSIAIFWMSHEPLDFKPIFSSGFKDCVLTVWYLINRIPLSLLNGKTPYAFLYGTHQIMIIFEPFGVFVTCINFKASAENVFLSGILLTNEGGESLILNPKCFIIP